jgi:hypothetical protein
LLAERMGARVIALDNNEAVLNSLYLQAKRRGLKILPLLGDFSLPLPSHGRKFDFPGSRERLACDVSLMLEIIHRLVFGFGVPFRRIADLLAEYTRRFSIVEFVPPECKARDSLAHSRREWYTVDNLIKEMTRHFELVTVVQSTPPRQLLLFRRLGGSVQI